MHNSKKITWLDALDRFELHLRAKGAAALTIDDYMNAVRHLSRKLDPLRLDQLHPADLREIQAGLLTGSASRSGKPLGAGAVGRHVAAWRSFFSLLMADGELESDPAAGLTPPRQQRRPVGQVLGVKDIEKLLDAAGTTPNGLRDRAVVELLYATGLRRAELCALDLSDLDHEEREVTVRRGKGGKARVVPVTRSAYAVVKDYLDLARPELASTRPASACALFLTRFGTRIDAKTVLRILDGLKKKAEVKKPVTPHTLRRCFATHLLQGGANLRSIQLMLGHASLAVTAAYLRLDAGEIRREVLLKHPRERFA
jgi:site-specific recombinase XerD